MLETLTHESFEPLVGTGFAIEVDGHEDVLTLSEVRVGKPIEGFRVPFSLTFNGARTDALFHSQTLSVRHDTLGELAFMISPLTRNADGTFQYQAVFN
ncbi:hypothetical protein [Sphingomonas sp.]|uniref:DUF6916 family protein n=1 Tax=Sphingomonas sp. TaxID=28214 RepID=UPI001B14C80D|nr:hypothetical protein [Sphingomonas sp.]MBO9711574.1 hypothetical protein [Sphingomonas sp.]